MILSESDIADKTKIPLPAVHGDVEFENVFFTENSAYILDECKFYAKDNSIGIVGESAVEKVL